MHRQCNILYCDLWEWGGLGDDVTGQDFMDLSEHAWTQQLHPLLFLLLLPCLVSGGLICPSP